MKPDYEQGATKEQRIKEALKKCLEQNKDLENKVNELQRAVHTSEYFIRRVLRET